MHVSELKVMRRKNLGNYEHEEVTVTMTQAPGDDVAEAMGQIEDIFKAYNFEPKKSVKLVAQVKKSEKKIAEPVKETIENVELPLTPDKEEETEIPPVIKEKEQTPKKEVATKKKTSKKKVSNKKEAAEEVSEEENRKATVQVQQACISLFNRWGSREPVDEIIKNTLGSLKMAKDMTYKEKVKVLKALRDKDE